MMFVYIYIGPLTHVKSPVKAGEKVWMTSIRKFGLPGFFPYFLENNNII